MEDNGGNMTRFLKSGGGAKEMWQNASTTKKIVIVLVLVAILLVVAGVGVTAPSMGEIMEGDPGYYFKNPGAIFGY